jgi:hypothetical protein
VFQGGWKTVFVGWVVTGQFQLLKLVAHLSARDRLVCMRQHRGYQKGGEGNLA